jgi:prepilin-type N-terminal cleavage/methylation domain-containing protein
MEKKYPQKRVIGFTLIELLVVIAIIGILSSALAYNFSYGVISARDARRIQELHQIAQAIIMYQAENEALPGNENGEDDCLFYGVKWDKGNIMTDPEDLFLKKLSEEYIISFVPKEFRDIKDYNGSSCVYRYALVENPCDGQCLGTYGILYAACEGNKCPVNERPDCCDGSSWQEGAGENDKKDIVIFIKSK